MALSREHPQEIKFSYGERITLSRPLDWLVVADHCDALAIVKETIKGNPTKIVVF